MKEQLKNLPFILVTQRRSLNGVKFITMWSNFESTRKVVANPLFVKASGVNLFHLVSCISAITILYFLSLLIVIQRPLGLYNDRTLQVANS
jgi:hypothetical protein